MQHIKVASGQSMIDIALQYYGSADLVFELALENGLSMTELLSPGQELIIKPRALSHQARRIANYYAVKQIMIVSGTEEVRQLAEFSTDFSTEFGGEFNLS